MGRRLVVAGDASEYRAYLERMGLDTSEAEFIYKDHQLYGEYNVNVYLVGDYQSSPVFELLMGRAQRCNLILVREGKE